MMADIQGIPPEISGTARLRPKRHRRRFDVLRGPATGAAAIVGFLLVRAVLTPDPDLLDVPPPEILGTWVTDDPRYADRAFVIREDEFHLQVATGEVLVSSVNTIRRVAHAEYDAYEITYFTPQGESTHEVHIYPDGIVRLKNPSDVVWTRR